MFLKITINYKKKKEDKTKPRVKNTASLALRKCRFIHRTVNKSWPEFDIKEPRKQILLNT